MEEWEAVGRIMASEIELKLCLTAAGLRHLRTAWLPAFTDAPIKTTQLRNTYFDTPALALHERRVALRLREKGGRIIQTLKTQGQSQGGLHQRDEWEWEIPQPQLDASLLQSVAFPPEVAVADLRPLFTTDFERAQVDIRLGGSLIELALDQGEVRANGRVAPVLEVELELKQGAPESLFALARQIASQVPVWASDVSKAERGYGLAGSGMTNESAPRARAQAVSGQSMWHAGVQLHRRWLRGIEVFRTEPSFAGLLAVDRSLAALRAVVQELVVDDAIAAGEDESGLLSFMDAAQADMARLLAEFATVGEKESLTGFEASPHAGLFSLAVSQYLMAHANKAAHANKVARAQS